MEELLFTNLVMKNRISLIIIGKDSSTFLNKFAGIFKLFDDVIYIDDYSSDNSEEICKILGLKYFRRKLNK